MSALALAGVLGVGVRPRTALAQKADLEVDDGIVVNSLLRTSAPNIWAAGDVARYPELHLGTTVRVEHWAVAQRQGQAVAADMLGLGTAFSAVPFFWSRHYDATINYVGHAERWDDVSIDGSLDRQDCSIEYRRGGKTLAVATIGRDRASLEAEARMEHSL